jgi:hypothetical protein
MREFFLPYRRSAKPMTPSIRSRNRPPGDTHSRLAFSKPRGDGTDWPAAGS